MQLNDLVDLFKDETSLKKFVQTLANALNIERIALLDDDQVIGIISNPEYDPTKKQFEQFVKRKSENSKVKKINNASLYAGDPMYFYCNGCDEFLMTLPENYLESPPRYCTPCEELAKLGLLNYAKKLYQSKKK